MTAPEPLPPGADPITSLEEAGAAAAGAADAATKIGAYRGQLPRPGVLVPLVGKGLENTWDAVWGWAQDTADTLFGAPPGVSYVTIDDVVHIARAYAGSAIKAMSGFVDDAAEIGFAAMDATAGFVESFVPSYVNTIIGIYSALGRLGGDITAIQDAEIPAILHEIGRVAATVNPAAAFAAGVAESWAVDNIFAPLMETIWRAAGNAHDETVAAAQSAKSYADGLVHNEALTRAAEVGALAAAVRALQGFQDDCSEPMCNVMGPKTDLGKWLKALNIAATAALLAELANLDEAGVESLVRGLASLSNGIVGDFERLFVGGGDTIAQTVGGLL